MASTLIAKRAWISLLIARCLVGLGATGCVSAFDPHPDELLLIDAPADTSIFLDGNPLSITLTKHFRVADSRVSFYAEQSGSSLDLHVNGDRLVISGRALGTSLVTITARLGPIERQASFRVNVLDPCPSPFAPDKADYLRIDVGDQLHFDYDAGENSHFPSVDKRHVGVLTWDVAKVSSCDGIARHFEVTERFEGTLYTKKPDSANVWRWAPEGPATFVKQTSISVGEVANIRRYMLSDFDYRYPTGSPEEIKISQRSGFTFITLTLSKYNGITRYEQTVRTTAASFTYITMTRRSVQ